MDRGEGRKQSLLGIIVGLQRTVSLTSPCPCHAICREGAHLSSPRVWWCTAFFSFIPADIVLYILSFSCPCSSMMVWPHVQKNRHQTKIKMNSPNPANGPYWLNNNSQLILTAARLYFALSSLNLLLTCPIRSRLSPLYNRSSIFFVMTFVTSRSSSFSLSRFCVARESEYVALVREMKVSNSMKA